MTNTNVLRRLIVAAAVATVGAAPIAARIAEARPAEQDVPQEVKVDDGNREFLVGHAVGVQIYSCGAGATGFSWGPAVPRANLYGDNGQLIVTHFAGPTWKAKDGSTVVGRRVDGITVDRTAIPWLKLEAASTAPGPDGDRLTHTTFIQRTATTGGMPPAASTCNADTVGDIAEIPYTADYHFWKSTGS